MMQEESILKSSQENILAVLADLLPAMQHDKEDRQKRKKNHQLNK